MIDKETIKQEIDRLSDKELEQLYAYLSSLKKNNKKGKPNIRSLHLKGKLDQQDLRSIAYE